MPSHIHVIWMPLKTTPTTNHQLSFMKFTVQKIKFWLLDTDSIILNDLLVEKKDRQYQIWQRNPLAIELYTPSVLEQKLDCIHNNPCQGKWMLANDPMLYPYSSAAFYESGDTTFEFLTHS